MSHDIPRGPNDDRLDAALNALRGAPIPDGPPEELVADTWAALRKAADESRPQTFFSRMMTMKSLPRIAAGLLLAVGVAVVASVMFRSSVSFAQVVDKIVGAKTMTFKATATIPSAKEPMQMQFSMTSDGRMRVEAASGTATVADQRTGQILILYPAMKRATVAENKSYGIAKNPIDEFKKFSGKAATPIGEKEVDGRKLKGFVTSDNSAKFTVWADKTTGDPVTIETTVPMMGGSGTIVMSDFVFDPKLDDAIFSLEPPQGYEVTTMDPKLMEIARNGNGEEHVIAALRGYAEKSDGKFPAKLDDWGAYAKLASATKANPTELQLTDLQLMGHVGALMPFLMSLPQDGWAYLGEGRTLGEKDAIVFWYKTEKGGYRAIYGDLTARDVKAEDLPKK